MAAPTAAPTAAVTATPTADTADLGPDTEGRASPGATRGMRRRLLHRVADSDATHITIGANEGLWQPFLPGVRIKLLHTEGDCQSYLLRLNAGATLPAHRHPRDEECIVLEGTLNIGSHTVVGPGGYHLAHQGALHAIIGTTTGATVFLRGAAPKAADVLGWVPWAWSRVMG